MLVKKGIQVLYPLSIIVSYSLVFSVLSGNAEEERCYNLICSENQFFLNY